MQTATEVNRIIEQRQLRDQMVKRLDVLDDVKKIIIIPKLGKLPVRQVADFFGVSQDTINKCYYANRGEIDSDGVEFLTRKNLLFRLGDDFPIKNRKGSFEIQLDENTTWIIPNTNNKFFSKRAVLRIAMLLRDSEVAKEVRSHLLNVFDTQEDLALSEENVNSSSRQEIPFEECKAISKVTRIKPGAVFQWAKDENEPSSNRPVIIISKEMHDICTDGKEVNYVLAIKATRTERGWASEIPLVITAEVNSYVYPEQVYKILVRSLGHYYGEVSPEVLLDIKLKQRERFGLTTRDLNKLKAQIRLNEKYS